VRASAAGIGQARRSVAQGLREATLLAAAVLALALPWSLPAAPAQLTPAALPVIAGEIALLLAVPGGWYAMASASPPGSSCC